MTANAAALIEQSKREERLSTTACARALGVTGEFIRGEIREGRLKARISKPEGRRRAKYRIDAADFDAYVREHWPKAG